MHQTSSGRAHGLVGQSPQIASIRRLIEKASANRLPVLLLGESGTGKEVVARAIHDANPRGQFVTIDCASIVGSLIETELFGHAKGAFTGASDLKRGLVEMADGGTAFFDEIGDLPLDIQLKLLRLIEAREYRPVGTTQWRKVDARIIAATHRDLKAEVAAGRFRLDLYYRLDVFAVRLPPLRHRKEDIPLLVNHFLSHAQMAGLQCIEPSQELFDTFQAYNWPGNVRELKHCIDRLNALRSEGALNMADLPSALLYSQSISGLEHLSDAVACPAADAAGLPDFQIAPKSPVISPVISLPDSERHAILQALAATSGERGKAARILQIGRTTLYRKMKQYGIE